VILGVVSALVLVSYSPPEVLFFVSIVYAFSGYALWIKGYFSKHTNAKESAKDITNN
jgi:CDP-diacylglycerol---serine O-phosphatidyltransferase